MESVAIKNYAQVSQPGRLVVRRRREPPRPRTCETSGLEDAGADRSSMDCPCDGECRREPPPSPDGPNPVEWLKFELADAPSCNGARRTRCCASDSCNCDQRAPN